VSPVNNNQWTVYGFFETFRTCETDWAPNAEQNNGFFLDILSNYW